MKEIFIVAEKELRDFLTGRRFLILIGIMLILVLIGILAGLQSYNGQLDQYKAQQEQNAQMFQQQQQQIDTMKENGASQEDVDRMQASLDASREMMLNQYMPSFLNFFYQFYMAFNFVGAMLAIVMGFDLISSERESGSLRLLLTRPTYRDSVINGKALAGVAVIAIILAAAFLLTMAVLMMSQVVPSGDDLYRIIAYFAVTLLFMVAIFAVSLLASTFSRTSKTAVLCMLGVFVFMYILGSSVSTITSVAMGPQPQYPQLPAMSMPVAMPVPMDPNATNGQPMPQPTLSPEMQAYQEAQWKYQNDSINYYKRQQQIRDITALLSPMDSYSQLTAVILSKEKPYDPADMYGTNWMETRNTKLTLLDSLGYKWVNLIALLAIVVAAFGLSYLSFMRSDVT